MPGRGAPDRAKRGGSRKGKRSKTVNVDGKPFTAEERLAQSRRVARVEQYARGALPIPSANARSGDRGKQQQRLRAKLAKLEGKIQEAAKLNVAREEFLLTEESGFLEPEHDLERTFDVRQADIKENVAAAASKQVYRLDLAEMGPYTLDWTSNGRHLLLGGRKGHLALVDARHMSLVTELHVRETIRDVSFLHSEAFFAVAQKKSLFIYDRDGVELHCLRQHVAPSRLAFLPYHFLLAAVGQTGFLKYTDVSTGAMVSEHRTRLGACDAMCQNPSNAVVHLGHHNGVVTLWSPAAPTPLVRLLAHHGPVKSVAVDHSGHYMVTAGLDRKCKVWDLRKYRELHTLPVRRPVHHVAISQRGVIAVGTSSRVEIWRDAFSSRPTDMYMKHDCRGDVVEQVSWRPFEDALGIGKLRGFESIVVPGAGEPNYDALEANPFESKKERREAEVHKLLDKLGPETIALDSEFIGAIDGDAASLERDMVELRQAARAGHEEKPKRMKNKMKGRSKIGAKLKRKHDAVDRQVRARKAEEHDAQAESASQDTGGSKKRRIEDPTTGGGESRAARGLSSPGTGAHESDGKARLAQKKGAGESSVKPPALSSGSGSSSSSSSLSVPIAMRRFMKK